MFTKESLLVEKKRSEKSVLTDYIQSQSNKGSLNMLYLLHFFNVIISKKLFPRARIYLICRYQVIYSIRRFDITQIEIMYYTRLKKKRKKKKKECQMFVFRPIISLAAGNFIEIKFSVTLNFNLKQILFATKLKIRFTWNGILLVEFKSTVYSSVVNHIL